MYSYVAYGLAIESTLALPELRTPSLSVDAGVDLVIAPLGEAPRIPKAEGVGLVVGYAPGEVLLRWSHFGTYRIAGGERIEYAPASGLSEAAVRVPLLGVCMGILLHQRGLLTLHASAVAVDGGAVAFVGEKGAGKSTTTAALVRRGHPLLSDDVTAVIGTEADATPEVVPGSTAVKLWPDSVVALGVDPSMMPLLHEGVEKRLLHVSGRDDAGPLPLRCIYVLDRGKAVASAPVQPRQAFSELVRHTYAVRFLGTAAVGARHFEQCTALAQRVPVRRLIRSDDVNELDLLTSHIESEWGQ